MLGLLRQYAANTEQWREQLLQQRMACKQQSIERLLTLCHQSWEEAFYISLCRNFGFHTYSVPFERLALQTPLAYLRKHRDNLDQLTAILLGQSGLLSVDDPLYGEYDFLRKKFSLTPLSPAVWRHACVRPQNTPERRIRQFARLLHEKEFLFSLLTAASSCEEACALLAGCGLGRSAVHGLMINTVIPYRYAWVLASGRVQEAQEVLQQLCDIPAEDNAIIRRWKALGVAVDSAADTQALIHFYQTYCHPEGSRPCQV